MYVSTLWSPAAESSSWLAIMSPWVHVSYAMAMVVVHYMLNYGSQRLPWYYQEALAIHMVTASSHTWLTVTDVGPS